MPRIRVYQAAPGGGFPGVAAGAPTIYAQNLFEGGVIGAGWSNPWGSGIDFPNDPTPRATGKVARLTYAPASGDSVERAVVPSTVPAQGYGAELWFKGNLHFITGAGSYNANHNRKLLDWQGTATRMTLHRRDGVLRVSVVSRMSGVETEEIAESTGISLPNETWHGLEVRTVMNSADDVRDGILQIFMNGATSPAYSRTTGLGWITDNGGALTSLSDFLVGMQLTIDLGDPTYTEERLWDDLHFSSGRLS